MRGKIIKIVSNQYTVFLENKEIVLCVAMGKVRMQKQPVVGDYVEVEALQGQVGIQKILPRKNELIRPAIANVDQALVVMSAKEPDFSSQLVDRLLFLIQHASICPILVITKMDLVQDENDPLFEVIEDYRKSGYTVLECRKEAADESLACLLKDKVTVLTGQSGVGKSTLLNHLNPDFKIETQQISKALGRGKHTTRHSELREVKGGWVADTPGFSSLDFSFMSVDELTHSVKEFQAYLGKCRFNDCRHVDEPGCAIKEALEEGKISKLRYAHYLEVYRLIKNKKEKY